MEEKGYIELSVTNKDNTLSPEDIDINEIKDFISDVEAFLYPLPQEKKNRPPIAYDIKKGSVKHRFSLPMTAVILFNGLANEIKNRNNIDFLEYKRQSIIDKFQKTAKQKGYTIAFNSSTSNEPMLVINNSTNFKMTAPQFYESEFYLYGEIYQEGGKKPNLHISTKEHGNLTISATKEQIINGEKKTYKQYGIKVRGKKSFEDGSLSDLKLIAFIKYQPKFDSNILDSAIEKASVNLSKIKNVDSWLEDVKAEGI